MDRLLTIQDVAEYLRVDASTLKRWRRSGGFCPPLIERGTVVRWSKADLDLWLRMYGREKLDNDEKNPEGP